jgi:hypothetical protein
MPDQSPRAALDTRYSEDDARAASWPDAVALLEQAGLFWVSTVRLMAVRTSPRSWRSG